MTTETFRENPSLPKDTAPLRLLVLAPTYESCERLTDEITESTSSFDIYWVPDGERLREAVEAQAGDAVICEVHGASLPHAVDALQRVAEPPPLILVADELSDHATIEALRFGASVCRRPHCRAHFTAAMHRMQLLAAERRQRRKTRAFEGEELAILEEIAAGASLDEALESVVHLIERQSEGQCSILLLDDDARTVKHMAAPNLPREYVDAIDGSEIGPEEGSCGAAAFRGERVVVDDISTHPFWKKYKELALPHGLVACWSTPIFSPAHEVLGTFAVYYNVRRSPTAAELHWVDEATHLASIAIVRERNVAKAKRLEEVVRAGEQVRAQIFDTVGDILFFLAVEPGEHYRFVTVNTSFLRTFSLTREQVVGKELGEIVPEPDLQRLRDLYARAFRERAPVRWDETTHAPDGSVRYGEVTVTPVCDDDGSCTGLVGTMHDLTERKLAEERIAAQAALLDHARDAIILKDIDGVIRYWNRGATKLYGWTEAEAIGKKASELFYLDSPQLEQAYYEVEAHGSWRGEIPQTTKDGHEITVDGSWTRLTDDQGRPSGVLLITTDITEKKALAAQVVLAQRMESLGTLAGGIAHDFNNILTAIIGNISLAKRRVPSDSPALKNLDVASSACVRAADLVRQILTFSRRHAPRRAVVELAAVVQDAMKLLRPSLPAMIELDTTIAPDVPRVAIDSSQIHQVLMNLVTNAAQAMDYHGTLRLRVENVDLTESPAFSTSPLAPGSYARLSVTDTGVGMTPETMAHIFDPFYTTKEPGKGTGLGLSIVHSVVKDHGGGIVVTSRAGEGSTFELYLPAATAIDEQAAGVALRGEQERGHGERILLVDDEAQVATLGEQILAGLGYAVTTCHRPAEALSTFRATPDRYAAVVTDFAMPHMSGVELAREIRRANLHVPIVLVSGYMRRDDLEAAKRSGVDEVLEKPASLGALASTLARLLRVESASLH